MSARSIDVDATVEATPSVLYDAVVLPDGAAAVEALRANGPALEFVKDQYRHCKPILALGGAAAILRARAASRRRFRTGQPIPVWSSTPRGAGPDVFIAALAKHRHFARETDPPRV